MMAQIATGNLPVIFFLLYVCLPTVIFALTLALRLPQWTKLAFLACYIYASTFVSLFRSGHVWLDYTMGATVGLFCFNCLHLTMVDPMKRYRHKSDDPVTGPNKLSLAGRVYWALCAIASVRGVGWNYQLPCISIPPYTTRIKFALNSLAKLLYYFFLIDIFQTILTAAPFLQNTQPDFSIRSLPFPKKVLCVVSWFFGVGYAGMSFEYYFVALLCVSTGLNSTVDWPAPFGHWTDSYSIKNFWSKTWHSFVRRLCVSPGQKLTQLLCIPSKTLPAAYIQLYTTFLISATVHSLGDYMVARQFLGASVPFFLIQPIGITIEEVFKYFLRQFTHPVHGGTSKSEPSSTAKVLGYIWVLWWFTVTGPLLLNPGLHAGFSKERMFPFSPVSSVLAFLYPSLFNGVA